MRVSAYQAPLLRSGSRVVDSRGNVLQSAQELTEALIVADLEISAAEPTAMR